MKKKILAFMLCMLLVANPCLAASTGVVTVSGGSIATGGLSGGYSEKTESAAITLTMALLYSLGLNIKLSQDAINAGQSAYSYMQGKFYEWVGGTSAEDMTDSEYEELKSRFSVINGGSNIGPDGKIYFNGTAIDLIRRFLNWLKDSNYIGVTPSSGVGGINNLNTFYGDIFDYLPATSTSSERYLGVSLNTGSGTIRNPVNILVYNVYDSATTFRRVYIGIDTGQLIYVNQYLKSNNAWFGLSGRLSTVLNGYRYNITSNIPLSEHVSGETFINNPDDTNYQQTVRDFINGNDSGNINVPDESGIDYEGDFDPDVLQNPDNKLTVVDPPVIDAMQENNPNTDAQIGVAEYLNALKQILNQVTNPQAVPEPVPAQDIPTLSPVQIEVPADLPLEWPVELPSSPDATPDLPTDNTPVTDPSAPVQPVDALPELTFNLDEYFPFCIPFDIYHLLSKFSAEPVTPVFDIGFTEPFTNSEVNFHVDLSAWDSVASAIRTAELGAFIVGLAVASRAIFTRG